MKPLISYQEALQKVESKTLKLKDQKISLGQSLGRVLTEETVADRDLPPYNRSTKDGIAIKWSPNAHIKSYTIQSIAAAGVPQQVLEDEKQAIEIMTGAIIPKNADTVVMYEDVKNKEGVVTLSQLPKKGSNVHLKGSDAKKGSRLLPSGTIITPGIIGILASIGKAQIQVKSLPSITIITTGDELIPIAEKPLPHQIRQSNDAVLKALLQKQYINATVYHCPDDEKILDTNITKALETSDVIMLCGGVSKGKYDYIPEVLTNLGVQKEFHRVAQQPGKPFWFGKQADCKTLIFGFPGNPISVFVNYHLYFLPWLACQGFPINNKNMAILDHDVVNDLDLTRILLVSRDIGNAVERIRVIKDQNSGDLVALAQADGLLIIYPKTRLKQGQWVTWIKV